jgi:hypothetical protein
MAGVRMNRLIAAVLAGSLVMSSTAAVASTAPAAPVQVSPWAALTGLTAGAPAATLCGAAAAAAATQTPAGGCVLPVIDTPPPVAEAAPPPVAPMAPVVVPAGYAVSPLFLALGALVAGSLAYFLVKNHHHDISPA